MRGTRGAASRWVIVGAAAAVVAAVVVAFVLLRLAQVREAARDQAARDAVDAVVQAWQDGDLTRAEQALQGGEGAVQRYAELTAGLAGATPERVEVISLVRTDEQASARLEVTWPFGTGWSYQTTMPVSGDLDAEGGGAWAAHLSPTTVHPDLTDGDRLIAERSWAPRADILGRDRQPLVTASPVVEVGVQPSRVTDLGALTTTLQDLLDVDGQALRQRVEAAAPEAFVPVITLRRDDYEARRGQLQPLPGTVFRESTLPLAPTREFARALLGTVGPVTAELVEESDGRLQAGDVAGLSGLQRQYDERLAGTAGVTVARVRGEDRTILHETAAEPGQPVSITLDADVQRAADAALAGASGGNGNASLVAVDIPTGQVLAVSNTPASGANRALTGQYPPGSTFKTISTLELLGTGLAPDETVPCPPTATVEGRSFRNFEGSAAGAVPFRTDFAESCNTAFVTLSQRLQPGDLAAAARSLGVGVDWQVGTPAFTGSVPTEDSAVELAAATIGQAEVLASPLVMAQAVSAVARGTWVAPSLVTDPPPAPVPPDAVPAADAAQLATVRDLMREVVLAGTAEALADVPGTPAHAKTGTAEFGTQDPPQTHAWTVGFRGDVAFAVIVEEGASGGAVAVPVAEAFLRSLG